MIQLGELAGAAEGALGGTPLGVGIAAVAVAAVVGAKAARPVAKGAIVGYLAVSGSARKAAGGASERVRQAAAEASEQLQDLYAEAKHEYEQERAAARIAPAPAQPAS